MKKLIIVISILVTPLLILAGTSDFPRGLTVATEAQKATADVAPGEGDIYVPGTLEVDGNIRMDGSITSALDISAVLTVDGGLILEPPATIVQLDTSTALGTLDAFVLVVGSNAVTGVFVMVSDATPFISTTTATNGQLITLMGTDATGTVQLSDNGTVSGSLLELDGTTIVLGLGSNITLRYYSGSWYQTGGINTID